MRRKPLYVSIAQRKEDRQAHLQLLYSHRIPGFSGPPSPVLSGGYPHLYYPAPGLVPAIPTPPNMMYQPPVMRPGWRANAIPNPSRSVVHPSPVTMVRFSKFTIIKFYMVNNSLLISFFFRHQIIRDTDREEEQTVTVTGVDMFFHREVVWHMLHFWQDQLLIHQKIQLGTSRSV